MLDASLAGLRRACILHSGAHTLCPVTGRILHVHRRSYILPSGAHVPMQIASARTPMSMRGTLRSHRFTQDSPGAGLSAVFAEEPGSNIASPSRSTPPPSSFPPFLPSAASLLPGPSFPVPHTPRPPSHTRAALAYTHGCAGVGPERAQWCDLVNLAMLSASPAPPPPSTFPHLPRFLTPPPSILTPSFRRTLRVLYIYDYGLRAGRVGSVWEAACRSGTPSGLMLRHDSFARSPPALIGLSRTDDTPRADEALVPEKFQNEEPGYPNQTVRRQAVFFLLGNFVSTSPLVSVSRILHMPTRLHALFTLPTRTL
ncbi:hypothetical protein B0H10DRAFT_2441977 [Mycena sp. CBHHK59/15]|nr:hypothetical protein B0H10DRAFT_2441977 [Mycena sp. CBHHK59/15]